MRPEEELDNWVCSDDDAGRVRPEEELDNWVCSDDDAGRVRPEEELDNWVCSDDDAGRVRPEEDPAGLQLRQLAPGKPIPWLTWQCRTKSLTKRRGLPAPG